MRYGFFNLSLADDFADEIVVFFPSAQNTTQVNSEFIALYFSNVRHRRNKKPQIEIFRRKIIKWHIDLEFFFFVFFIMLPHDAEKQLFLKKSLDDFHVYHKLKINLIQVIYSVKLLVTAKYVLECLIPYRKNIFTEALKID